MKHSRSVVSIAQALRRTFIAPVHTSRAGLIPLRLYQPMRHELQSRSYQLPQGPAPLGTNKAPPINEAINAPYIQLVNEKNELDPPIRLSKALASFDPLEFFLVQVAQAELDRPPVCKILNKKEHREREKAKAKAAKASRVQTKQIELNWAIDAHDLEHRLKQLTNFLEKGRKVEVILTRPKKRGKRAATVDEIKHVMQSVIETIKECGGSQVKPMDGDPGQHVIITAMKQN